MGWKKDTRKIYQYPVQSGKSSDSMKQACHKLIRLRCTFFPLHLHFFLTYKTWGHYCHTTSRSCTSISLWLGFYGAHCFLVIEIRNQLTQINTYLCSNQWGLCCQPTNQDYKNSKWFFGTQHLIDHNMDITKPRSWAQYQRTMHLNCSA